MAKFQLSNETKKNGDITLYRIIACSDFGDIKFGDKGGFVEKEDNLSQYGNAEICDNAKVYGNAVSGASGAFMAAAQSLWQKHTKTVKLAAEIINI